MWWAETPLKVSFADMFGLENKVSMVLKYLQRQKQEVIGTDFFWGLFTSGNWRMLIPFGPYYLSLAKMKGSSWFFMIRD